MFVDNRPRERHVSKDIQQFHQEHTTPNNPSVMDRRNGSEYFYDGAMATDVSLHDPPPAGTELLLRRRYHYAKLRYNEEVENFERFRAESVNQISYAVAGRGNVPSAAADTEQRLVQGAVRINALKKELDALDEQVSKLPAETVQRQRAELEANRVAELQKRRDNLLNMNL